MWRLMWLIGVGCGLWLSSVLKAQEQLPPPPPKPGIVEPEEIAPAKAASFVYDNSNELFEMLDRMYSFHLYPPGFGHTAAVAHLAWCMPGGNSDDKADLLDRMIRLLPEGNANLPRVTLVRSKIKASGDLKRSGDIALLAALLACKKGDRHALNVISNLDGAIEELSLKMKEATGKTLDYAFYNLITAAAMMY